MTTSALRRERELPPQRSGGRAHHCRIGCEGTVGARDAQAAPRAAAPRERRDSNRPKGRDDSPTASRRERAPRMTTSALRREHELFPQRSCGRAQHRHIGCGGTAGARSARAAPRAAAPREQRDGDRPEGCDDCRRLQGMQNATGGDAHRAESARRRCRGAAAERNTAASDAAARRARGEHERRRVQRRRESSATATVAKDAATRRRRALRRARKPPPQRSGGQTPHRRNACSGTVGARSAQAALRAATPRK